MSIHSNTVKLHTNFTDINEGKVEVYMHAPIMISAAESDDTKVLTGKVTFTLSNKFDGTFMVIELYLITQKLHR